MYFRASRCKKKGVDVIKVLDHSPGGKPIDPMVTVVGMLVKTMLLGWPDKNLVVPPFG